MLEENQKNWPKQFLKALGFLALALLVMAIVGFGLLVGVCGIMGKR
jgi:hypothetical protein